MTLNGLRYNIWLFIYKRFHLFLYDGYCYILIIIIILNIRHYQRQHYSQQQSTIASTLYRSLKQKMEQACVTCGAHFDYFQNVATVVCYQNHVVCRNCAKQLYRTSSKCPYCLGPLRANNNLNSESDQNQRPNSSNPDPYLEQSSQQYWRPVPNQQPVRPIIVQDNVGAQVPQRQAGQPAPIYKAKSKAGIYFCVGLICLISGISLTVTRVSMDNCSYWSPSNHYNCYYSGTLYCCDDYSYCSSSYVYSRCYSISYYRNDGLYTFVLVSIFFTFFFSICMCCMSCQAKSKKQKEILVARANGYVIME